MKGLTLNDMESINTVCTIAAWAIENHGVITDKNRSVITELSTEDVEKLRNILNDIFIKEKIVDPDLIHLSLLRKQVDQVQDALHHTAEQCMVMAETGKALRFSVVYAYCLKTSVELTEIATSISQQLNAYK